MALVKQFQAEFDGSFFDRNAREKREQSGRGRSLWSVFGICAVCRKFIYLYRDEETPAHCGRPLPHFTRRQYNSRGDVVAETTGVSSQAEMGIDHGQSGDQTLGTGSWEAKGMCCECGHWVYVGEDRALPMHCGQPLINLVYRKGTSGTP